MARPFRTATREEFPTLDVGPYLAGEAGALESLAQELNRACCDVGFMMIVNHGVPQDIINDAFAAIARFHALPLEEKLALKVNNHQIGYVPMAYTFNEAAPVDGSEKVAKRDASENFTYNTDRTPDDPKVVSGERFRGLNQWPAPDRVPGFREAMVRYHETMTELGYRLLPVYAAALDLAPDFFGDYFKDPTTVVRAVRYPDVGELRDDQFGASSHTDAGFITFLPQAAEPGLQIQTRGGEWLDQPVVPGAFVVNSGNVLKRWSNDRFIATPHRVTTSVGRDRYSLPFFFNPDLDDCIECLPTCTGLDNPPKYEPFTYRDWYTWYLEKTYAHYQNKNAAE